CARITGTWDWYFDVW
nr:immunoglobulin heavy chain junction region [Mus musculus]MBK4188816.1 immunoglobulin heavy chain junction region [Mus musculus]